MFSGTTVLDYDDPLNPFKHTWHPDHDNLDARFEQKLAEGIESFTVTRSIALTFMDTDPEDSKFAGWGDSRVGGIYRETITGLHRASLYMEGTFQLQQACRTSLLDQ